MLDLSQSAMLSSVPNSKLQHFMDTTMKIEATLIVSPAIWILDAVERGRSMKNLLEVSSQHEFPLARNNPEEIDVFRKMAICGFAQSAPLICPGKPCLGYVAKAHLTVNWKWGCAEGGCGQGVRGQVELLHGG
jgi:hypothetical protein